MNFGYALFLALRERKVDSNQIEKIVRKWLALSILTGRYSSGSPESAFDYDIKRFFAYDLSDAVPEYHRGGRII